MLLRISRRAFSRKRPTRHALYKPDHTGLHTIAQCERLTGEGEPERQPEGRSGMMGELEPEGECVSVDTSVPHIARVYDYWLGGKDNFAVDRAAAEQVMATFPDILVSVRAQRAFLGRAVHYLVAEAGIRQFLDIGTGLPSGNNTHEVAQRVAPQLPYDRAPGQRRRHRPDGRLDAEVQRARDRSAHRAQPRRSLSLLRRPGPSRTRRSPAAPVAGRY